MRRPVRAFAAQARMQRSTEILFSYPLYILLTTNFASEINVFVVFILFILKETVDAKK